MSQKQAEENGLNRYGIRYVIREFIGTIVMLIFLLISSGSLQWLNAWFCTGLVLAYQIVNIIVLNKLNPTLLNKRGQIVNESTKRFDKIFIIIYLLLAYTLPIVAGLDAIRYEWSRVWFGLSIIGVVIFILSCGIGIWAMAENTFFEMTVFINTDRHRVCTTGPYKIIRHPGYVAEILALLSFPLILGSWFSYIPVGGLICLFIVRTALEDKTLIQELPGYREYTMQTRYRLIPFIW